MRVTVLFFFLFSSNSIFPASQKKQNKNPFLNPLYFLNNSQLYKHEKKQIIICVKLIISVQLGLCMKDKISDQTCQPQPAKFEFKDHHHQFGGMK